MDQSSTKNQNNNFPADSADKKTVSYGHNHIKWTEDDAVFSDMEPRGSQ